MSGDIEVTISKQDYVKIISTIPMEYRWMSAGDASDPPRLQLWTVNWKTGENRKVVFLVDRDKP